VHLLHVLRARAEARAILGDATCGNATTLSPEIPQTRPRPASQIEAAAEAAEIPERSLIAATDALDVRCRQGLWWLPG
jgi:hypothetical protein